MQMQSASKGKVFSNVYIKLPSMKKQIENFIIMHKIYIYGRVIFTMIVKNFKMVAAMIHAKSQKNFNFQ